MGEVKTGSGVGEGGDEGGIKTRWWDHGYGHQLGMGYENGKWEMWDGNGVGNMVQIYFQSFSWKRGVALTKLGCGFNKSLLIYIYIYVIKYCK